MSVNTLDLSTGTTGGGSVTGGGTVTYGQSVVLTATPAEGKQFVGWRRGSSETYFSTSNPLTLDGLTNDSVIAVFEDAPVMVTVTAGLRSGSVNMGSAVVRVNGTDAASQTVEPGTSVTFVATPNSGKVFYGWYNQPTNGTRVSTSIQYTVTVNENTALYANIGDPDE